MCIRQTYDDADATRSTYISALFLHNLYFYNNLMTEIRESIDNGCFAEYKKNMLESMAAGPQD